MNRKHTIAAATLAAGGILLTSTAAGADPYVTLDSEGAPASTEEGFLGQPILVGGEGCTNPAPGEPAYMGQFVSTAGDPSVETGTKEYEAQVDVGGSFTWDTSIPLDHPMGVFYSRWYCSTAPATTIDDPAMLWVSPLYTFTIDAARAKGAGSVDISVDPESLPAKDIMGIHGETAAALKARVDARAEAIGSAQRLYTAFLGRVADHDGLAYWTAEIERGVPMSTLARRFAGTPEFRNGRGRMGDSAFVDALYKSVLGRTPDAAGREYWAHRLEDGTISRTSMVTYFAHSRENVARTASHSYVVAAYQVLGTSTPTSDQVAQQVAKLDEGQVKVSVVEDIALSIDGAEAWMARG
ncbi:DUF4214 domain-containing protein [Iamia majanohamensis]|uniref:DUF4214 domain-containing protein n=1 Tax=Iamia majanohamensis TaxID=467976 RepID=A0AAE9YBL1_9ACTN|nr:DUF4214 domain-containing protein [Iamia majanohamensis]WCO66017.1 DUF4214 domain-containing protein [Iamia majanohamensis]